MPTSDQKEGAGVNQLDLFPTRVHLRWVDRANATPRFYVLSVQPTLFGEWTLVREWGRVGISRWVRSDLYPSSGSAIDALLDLSRKKSRRGYRPVGSA